MASCVDSYSVALKSSARKELARLSASLIERIVPKLEMLGTDPRPAGCRKLKGGDSEWRIRIGDYRVVYTIDDHEETITVSRIRHRSEVYER